MKAQKFGNQTPFELSASLETALKYWGYRHRLRWNDRIVLGSNGTLLCDVPALKWHRGDIVPPHSTPTINWTVENRRSK